MKVNLIIKYLFFKINHISLPFLFNGLEKNNYHMRELKMESDKLNLNQAMLHYFLSKGTEEYWYWEFIF